MIYDYYLGALLCYTAFVLPKNNYNIIIHKLMLIKKIYNIIILVYYIMLQPSNKILYFILVKINKKKLPLIVPT